MYTLKGNIKVIKPTQNVNEKFRKREFVITDNSSQYPQDILFQLTQDRCEMLDQSKPGDAVEVSFNIRGREWTSPKDGEVRYFNSLEVFRIQNVMGVESSSAAPSIEINQSDESDDLPF